MKFEYIDIIAVISGIISCVIVVMLVRNIVHDKRRLKEMGADIDNHDNYNNDYHKLQAKMFLLEEKIDIMEDKNEMLKEDIKRIMYYNIDTVDTIDSFLIAQTMNSQDAKRRKSLINSLRRNQARLATQPISFSEKEKRLMRMHYLIELGEESDLVDLERIIHNPNEDKDVKDLASYIKIQIEKRLKEELNTKEELR